MIEWYSDGVFWCSESGCEMEAILEIEQVSLEEAKTLVSSLTWDEKRQLVAELLRQMVDESPVMVGEVTPSGDKASARRDLKGLWADFPPITDEMINEMRKELWNASPKILADSGNR